MGATATKGTKPLLTVCWKAERCPFCGWTPNIQWWHGGTITKRMISCDYEKCTVRPSVTGDTEGKALRKWNKRAE